MTEWNTARPVQSWIKMWDEAPGRHLPLFEAARDALLAPAGTSQDESLSRACERWRYQLLAHKADPADVTRRTLIDTLDLASNRLADGPRRPPKNIASVATPVHPTLVCGRTTEDWLHSPARRRELIRLAARLTKCRATAGLETERTARWPVSLFAPIYLSNYCVNSCPYCWFRYEEKIERRLLTVDEVGREAQVLADQGVKDVLLVAGDYPQQIKMNYLGACAREAARREMNVRIEVAPLGTWDYKALLDAGVEGVTLYQETYDRSLYAFYHSEGRKSRYEWRLESLDRAADAGMRHLGLGVLLGLADPLEDLAILIEHGRYLAERYPQAKLAFSLPRIHSGPNGFRIFHPVEDTTLVLMYCLLRLAFPEAELVLSTRESAALRNRLVKLCITRLSAGSKTAPGAYSALGGEEHQAGMQFPIADQRPISEIRNWLSERGYVVA